MIRKTTVLPRLPEANAERIRRDLQHRDRADRQHPNAEAELATDVDGNTNVTVLSSGTTLYHRLGREPDIVQATDLRSTGIIHCSVRTKSSITVVSSVAATLCKVMVA